MAVHVNHDLVVHSSTGRLVAAFEVRALSERDARWAAQYRANLLEILGESPADYFGIITPSTLFLWKEDQSSSTSREPDREIEMRGRWRKDLPPEAFRGWAFEFTVASLLSDWIDPFDDLDDRWPELESVGLLAALKGGSLTFEAAA